MRRSLLLFTAVMLFLAACAPAAAPSATQAPAAQPAQPAQPPAAQPTKASEPTKAPEPTSAPAAAPTDISPTQPGAELRPPVSGGGLTSPTLVPTPIGLRTNANSTRWLAYRDATYGFAFQYPPDWTFGPPTNAPKDVLLRLSVARLNQSRGNNAEIVIDVRKSTGDLLKWLQAELPQGTLQIEARAIEGGLNKLTAYNAKLSGAAAVWVFAPTHSTIASVAELHVADQQYFYQITYLGDIPDNKDTRTVYLQLLSTLTLSGTTTASLALPTTTFITQ